MNIKGSLIIVPYGTTTSDKHSKAKQGKEEIQIKKEKFAPRIFFMQHHFLLRVKLLSLATQINQSQKCIFVIQNCI